jgi:hypothetical protein
VNCASASYGAATKNSAMIAANNVVARDENLTRANWEWFGKNGSFMSLVSAGVVCFLEMGGVTPAPRN